MSAQSSPSSSKPRPKPPRTTGSSTGVTRQRSAEDSESPDVRAPPAKRARKAINCDPCRTSKLKCDRARPCSSCVLRGTVSQCYQGADGQPLVREDVQIDPVAEFARLRHTLSLLEKHYLPDNRKQPSVAPLNPEASSSSSILNPKPDDGDNDANESSDVPGMTGRQAQNGFYTGATSTGSYLSSDMTMRSRSPSEESPLNRVFDHDYDHDLVDLLPPLHIIDALVDYYFEYCNWIYRHVNQPAFQHAWKKFKDGSYPDRIVLATAAVLVSLAIRYLPPGHELLTSLPGAFTHEEHYLDLSRQYYEVMKTCLRRHRDHTKTYTLELVELLLIRCHYLTFAKTDPEEIWTVRGELVTIGTAMGLHRDPGKSRFPKEACERRRWAWWHIILLERWQAFMFGRPLAIASHHFNTQLPSYCDREIDPSGRLYFPNIALFRLAFILGEIMEDAVSLRPVSYESFKEKDKLLTQWMDSLPAELELDNFKMARSLSSPITAVRRAAVQSIIIRTAYHHIRFTLHRPFAGIKESNKMNESLEIAVKSADELLSLAAQSNAELVATDGAKSQHPIHGHLNWRPFHIFSAGMFFTFQLIQNPSQPGAKLFRSYVRKCVEFLRQSPNMPVTEKALVIFATLDPLYSEGFLSLSKKEQEKQKIDILAKVKTLAFPYQDPPPASKYSNSPLDFAVDTLTTPYGSTPGISSPVSKAAGDYFGFASLNATNQYGSSSSLSTMPSMTATTSLSPGGFMTSPTASTFPSANFGQSNPAVYMQQQLYQQQLFLFGDAPAIPKSGSAYVPPADEWGGAAGFGHREWLRFMDVMQRPQDSD